MRPVVVQSKEATYFTINANSDSISLWVAAQLFWIAHHTLLLFALFSHGEDPVSLGLHHLHHGLVLIQASYPHLLLSLLKLMRIWLRHGCLYNWPIKGSIGMHGRNVLALLRMMLHRPELFRRSLGKANHALIMTHCSGHVGESRIVLSWKRRTCHRLKAHLVLN